jgi:hypothetical protein
MKQCPLPFEHAIHKQANRFRERQHNQEKDRDLGNS